MESSAGDNLEAILFAMAAFSLISVPEVSVCPVEDVVVVIDAGGAVVDMFAVPAEDTEELADMICVAVDGADAAPKRENI